MSKPGSGNSRSKELDKPNFILFKKILFWILCFPFLFVHVKLSVQDAGKLADYKGAILLDVMPHIQRVEYDATGWLFSNKALHPTLSGSLFLLCWSELSCLL